MNGLEANLVQQAGISPEVLDRARERLRDGKDIGDVLLEMGALTADRWGEIVAQYYGLPFIDTLPTDSVPLDLVTRLPIQFAKRHNLLPIRVDGDAVIVATANPSLIGPIDDLRLLFGKAVRAVVAPAPLIADAINSVYDRASGSTAELVSGLDVERLDLMATELEEPEDLLDASDEAPIIRLVNQLIFQAVKDRTSDIHIEPFERQLVVRFRIDGILYDIVKPPKRFQPVILSRVKIMAGLNIAEKRLPQDGRIRTKIAGKDVDIRVSVIPTAFGERIVMRLLDRSATLLPLDDLGLAGQNLKTVQRLIHQSHGIILVTGPTGSGKTTTLYASLQKINSNEKNIITIEDPIEYQLAGVGQMQVNPKIELTFANGLRSILRQDPDVIMVGEIRDLETLRMGVQSALTGHLVLTTVHCNDAASGASRLIDMGAEPFLVASAATVFLSQRLVRMICSECRAEAAPRENELRMLRMPASEAFFRGKGCDHCRGTGYFGRTSVFEIMMVNDAISAGITRKETSGEIRHLARSLGMRSLVDDALDKAKQGITSLEEIVRAVWVAEE